MPPFLLVYLLLDLIVAGSGDPAGEAILKKVDATLAGVKDYTVTLEVTPRLEGVNVPLMHMTMFYKQPDKIAFTSQGFALLPREVVGLTPSRLLQHYFVEQVEQDTRDGVKVRRVHLKPRNEMNRARGMILEVSVQRWTVERVSITFPENRTLTCVFEYQNTGGAWLPSFLTVTLGSASVDTAENVLPDQPGVPSVPRMALRAGSVTVRYFDYRLNTGLPDDLFKADKTGQSD